MGRAGRPFVYFLFIFDQSLLHWTMSQDDISPRTCLPNRFGDKHVISCHPT